MSFRASVASRGTLWRVAQSWRCSNSGVVPTDGKYGPPASGVNGEMWYPQETTPGQPKRGAGPGAPSGQTRKAPCRERALHIPHLPTDGKYGPPAVSTGQMWYPQRNYPRSAQKKGGTWGTQQIWATRRLQFRVALHGHPPNVWQIWATRPANMGHPPLFQLWGGAQLRSNEKGPLSEKSSSYPTFANRWQIWATRQRCQQGRCGIRKETTPGQPKRGAGPGAPSKYGPPAETLKRRNFETLKP